VKAETSQKLEMVTQRLEPNADFDPNILAWVRRVPDALPSSAEPTSPEPEGQEA
jgi:hypothetical protein